MVVERRLEPDSWSCPEVRDSEDTSRLRGTRGGSLLYEQPAHRAFAERVRAFCDGATVLNVEVGVDRGYRLLAHARRWPDQRWLGIELRRTVDAAAQAAPENALLVRGDGRAVLGALVPDGRLQRVDILFPSPSNDPRHILLTADIERLLRKKLAPDGVLLLATDVPDYMRVAEHLFAAWTRVPEPPSGPVRSRREKVCARDGRPVWRYGLVPPGRDSTTIGAPSHTSPDCSTSQ